MRQLNDYSDVRYRGFCIHCGEGLHLGNSSRDHVPTRALLDRPHPDNLPTIDVCRECNNSFSKDENYRVALIACVITGSVELNRREFSVASGILARSVELAARIERASRVQLTLWGDAEVQWSAELDRVESVVVKNARGHAFHELGLPLQFQPSHVVMSSLLLLSGNQRSQFERWPDDAPWPEVGSRMMQRLVMGDLNRGWVTVQEGVYRYMVVQLFGGTVVRSVIREYMATEVLWSDETDNSADLL